jgi:hypothetical protein
VCDVGDRGYNEAYERGGRRSRVGWGGETARGKRQALMLRRGWMRNRENTGRMAVPRGRISGGGGCYDGDWAQGSGVFVQLADEATIWLRVHPFRLNVVHSLVCRPTVSGYEVRRDDARAPADALYAMNEHFGVLVPQRVREEVRRVRQECREFCERRVEEGYLEFADG